MSRPRLIDFFCGAGGCSRGYHDAGFDVVGVDINPQPRYPYPFVQMDALMALKCLMTGGFIVDSHGLRWYMHEFDAIHASPPCQKYSAMTKGRWKDREHADLIDQTRELLEASGKPWVIENVSGAPLRASFVLCGTMFGLKAPCGAQLRRHRLFESPACGFALIPPCQHNEYSAIGVYGGGQHPQRRYGGEPDRKVRIPATIGVYGNAGGSSKRDGLLQFGTEARRIAMGIDWMSGKELSQAIPPAYTEFIGRQLMAALEATR